MDASGLSPKSQAQDVQRGERCRVRDGGGKSAAAGVVGGGFRALVGVVVPIIVFLMLEGSEWACVIIVNAYQDVQGRRLGKGEATSVVPTP